MFDICSKMWCLQRHADVELQRPYLLSLPDPVGPEHLKDKLLQPNRSDIDVFIIHESSLKGYTRLLMFRTINFSIDYPVGARKYLKAFQRLFNHWVLHLLACQLSLKTNRTQHSKPSTFKVR